MFIKVRPVNGPFPIMIINTDHIVQIHQNDEGTYIEFKGEWRWVIVKDSFDRLIGLLEAK